MVTDKLYRVIEPIDKYVFIDTFDMSAGDGDCFICDKEMETTQVLFEYEEGDVVDFKQIEKGIEEGLQPIYFTEEVIEHHGVSHYGEYFNFTEFIRLSNKDMEESTKNVIDLNRLISQKDGLITMLKAANKSYKENTELTLAGVIMQNKMNKIDNFNLKGYFIDENDLSKGQVKAIEKLINEE